MTFPPPLHGERPSGSKPEIAASPPLAPGDTLADRYAIDLVLHVAPTRTVYRASDPRGTPVYLLEMSAPLHLDDAFDPNETVPLSAPDKALVLPPRDHGTHGSRSFAVFDAPRGTLICAGGQYPWDPDRLLLVDRILRSFRRARDRRVYIPHIAWETLFVDAEWNVTWASPAVTSARFRVESRGMTPSVSVFHPPSVDAGAVPLEDEVQVQQLDEYYMAKLREILPPLILRSFSAHPPPAAEEDVLPEEIPWAPEFMATPECRMILSQLISGRLGAIDDAIREIDRFGPSRVVRLINGWRTHRGRVRELNEDALMVMEQSSVVASRPTRHVLFAVADGMGGHEAGEVASEITLKALSTQVLGGLNVTSALELGRRIHDHEYMVTVVSTAIDRTNEVLREYTQEAHANSRKKPGSTLVFALTSGPIATIGHVGDSRAYKIGSDGTLERITRDHSPVQRMVDMCKITQEEAFLHPNRHQIYSNIGISPTHLMKGLEIRYLREGEGLLLCSDGLSDMLRDSEIEDICRDVVRDPRRLAQALVEGACAAGGMDNVTVIVVVRTPSPFKEEREIPPNVPDEVEEADA